MTLVGFDPACYSSQLASTLHNNVILRSWLQPCTIHVILFFSAVGYDPAYNIIHRSWLRPCVLFFAVGSDPAHVIILRSWLRPCMSLIAIGSYLANTITITRFPFSSP